MEKNYKKGNNASQNQNSSKPQKAGKVQKPQPLVINENNKYVLGGYFSLGLTNFFKTALLVFTKAGIKVISDNGNIIYSDEKIGQVLYTLYKSTLNPRPSFEPFEQAWANNFKLNTNQQVKLQKLLFHHFPILGPIMADEAAYKVNNSKKSNVTDAYTMTYGVTLPDCLKVLSTIAQGLIDCRNTDVHYEPYSSIDDLAKQYLVQEDIVRYLIKALVASRRLDKKRNSIETEKMEFLTGYAKAEKDDNGKNLEKYLRDHNFYPKYDQEIVRDENGNIVYVVETDKDGKPLKDKDGNPKYKMKKDWNGNYVREEKTRMVERSDYFYKIGGQTTIEQDEKAYSTLTGFGLAYFCTIFLTKPQAKQMLSDVALFEKSPYPREFNDIIRDMLSIYRIRAPRGKKLEGSDTKITLALDMLNELRKCPKELYDVLSPKGQKYFEDEVKRPNERTPEVVKRFRSTDRFPYLALRYIDETKSFENIRFQVQLGKLRFKFYPKTCINGEKEIRSLQKEINGFGRIQELEQRRQTEYKDFLQAGEEKSVKIEGEDINLDLLQFEKDRADSKPYITNSKAYYNIHNNRIGLFWNEREIEDKEGNKSIKQLYGDYLPSLKNVKDGKAPVTMHAPMAMLSVHELSALVFYDYLYRTIDNEELKKKTKNAENIIIDKCYSLQKFFSDVSKGAFTPVERKKELRQKLLAVYGLELNEIPNKLAKYLTNKKVDINRRRQQLTRDRLVRMLKRAIRRRDGFKDDRKMIGDKENKYGKNSYVDVRHGSLARYLSESFLEWQPSNEDGDNKLTGMNFSKLQSELAVFDGAGKSDLIKQMLGEAGLLSGSYAHPFLPEVMVKAIRNIEEFYLFYLNTEVRHIKHLLGVDKIDDKRIYENKVDFNTISIPDFDYSRLPFIKGEARWSERTSDNCKQLANRYLEVEGKRAPIWLPDGIFTKQILGILKTQFSNNKKLQESLADENLTAYASYLIRMFFEHQLNDYSQPFYSSSTRTSNDKVIPNDFAHIYDLFNILNNVKKRNAYVKVPMIIEDINALFSTNATDEYGDLIERVGPDGKPLRDERQNILYKKIIHTEIDQLMIDLEDEAEENIRKKHLFGNRAEKARKTGKEEREKLYRKCTHLIGEVKDNEKAIRRYKAQDMVMFLMAERLMEESEATGNVSKSEKFKLQNVCYSDFLSQTVNFEFPFKVGKDTVKITQEVISLKNLGEFYQLLSDERLPSLLERLLVIKKKEQQDPTFGYSELMGELASYNIHRSRIFKAIHCIEKYVVSKENFKFLYNPTDKRFYIDDDDTRDPKRNNFRSLLELLEEGDIHALSKDERELIISIRNAFSHNHYEIDFDDIASEKDLGKSTLLNNEEETDSDAKKKELTTIATLIAKKLEELQEKVERIDPKKK